MISTNFPTGSSEPNTAIFHVPPVVKQTKTSNGFFTKGFVEMIDREMAGIDREMAGIDREMARKQTWVATMLLLVPTRDFEA